MSSRRSQTGAVRPVRRRREGAGARASPRTAGAARPGRAQRRGSGGAHRPVDRQRLAASPADAARRTGGKPARRQVRLYRLADDAVLDLLAALRRIAERNVAEVERVVRSYFHERDSLEPVSREELAGAARARARDGARRAPGRRICLGPCAGRDRTSRCASLKRASPSSTRDRRSSPTAAAPTACCPSKRSQHFAHAASRRRRLEDGLPEWRAAGLPVVTGNA